MSNLSLKPVANGKTVFFNSQLTRENELVRTGISLENSFYHALLLAYTEDYSSSSEDERNEMVNKFITSLNKKITQENWQDLNFKHKIIPLDLVLIKTIEAFYEYLETRRNSSSNTVINNIVRELRIDSNFSLFEAIFELISFSHFKNTLKSTLNELNNNSMREYKPIFIENILNCLQFSKEFRSLDQEKKRYINNIISNFLTVFFRELESECFKMVKDKVMFFQGGKVNPFLLSLVCSRFKRDLFIIDSTTKLPLKYHDFVTGKKSFVLLKFDDNFELVGRLKQKNNIDYEFDSDDEYIKKLSMFLLNPEKFKNKYPQLLSEAKNKRNVYVSDSESEPEEEQKMDLPPPLYEQSSDEEEQVEERSKSRKEKNSEEGRRESRLESSRHENKESRRENRLENREERNRQKSSRDDRRERNSSKPDKRESGFKHSQFSFSSDPFSFETHQPPPSSKSKTVINNFLYQSDSDSD